MAIEIPSLAADRLPHPEWGPAAALGRYALPAGRLLGVLEGAAAPAPVLDGLRAVAGSGGSVQLLVAPDRALVQILLDGRRIPLTGAARDAVLTLLGDTAMAGSGPRAAASGAGMPDAFAAARVAAVDAQVQQSRSHAGEPPAGVIEPARPAPPAVSLAPLMTAADAGAASQALARVVGESGLFLEAHVAQWLRGERTLGQLHEETRMLPPVTDGAHAAASENRARGQLEAQQHQAVQLQVPAWPGQPMQLEIARDPERRADAADAAAGLFQATLSLHLPRLGTLNARIRLLHDTVGLQLAAEHVAQLAPALQDLATALSVRGLTLAALELAPADAGAALPGSRP